MYFSLHIDENDGMRRENCVSDDGERIKFFEKLLNQ